MNPTANHYRDDNFRGINVKLSAQEIKFLADQCTNVGSTIEVEVACEFLRVYLMDHAIKLEMIWNEHQANKDK